VIVLIVIVLVVIVLTAVPVILEQRAMGNAGTLRG